MKKTARIVAVWVMVMMCSGGAVAQDSQPSQLSKTWKHTVHTDDMTDATTHILSLESEEDEQVMLLFSKVEGKMILTVLSERRRFDCDIHRAMWATEVLLRVDEDKAFTAKATCNKKDHGMIWPNLMDQRALIAKLGQGEQLKLRATHVLHGSQTYTFHIAGLDLSKLK